MFQNFSKCYGKASTSELASKDDIKKYERRVPSVLSKLWEEEGWCSYKEGKLWIVNPETYADVITEWIDPEHEPIVIARTAFADLFVWMDGFVFFLDVQSSELTEMEDDMELFFNLFLCDSEVTTELFRDDLFEKVMKKNGQLKADECYAFVPVLALGGSENPDTVKKVKIREHLYILSQIVG